MADLRAWRATRARADDVPAYVVAHDALLAAIVEQRPGSRLPCDGSRGWARPSWSATARRSWRSWRVTDPAGPAPRRAPRTATRRPAGIARGPDLSFAP